jgi:hypothetical protein
MKRKSEKCFALLFLVFGILMIFPGCQQVEMLAPLEIKGDVSEIIEVHEVWPSLEKTRVEWNGEKVEAVEVKALVEDFALYQHYDWMIVAEDGFMVRIGGESVDDTYLSYAADKQWYYISEKHPVNSRVKRIKEIILIKDESEEPVYDTGLTLIIEGENHHFSTGELLARDHRIVMQTDGVSRSGDISIEVMKQKQVVPLSDLLDFTDRQMLLMSESGEMRYESKLDGAIELENGEVHYRGLDPNTSMRNLLGIIVDPPKASNMDAYHDAKYYLEHQVPVLMIFLDGFSYAEYQALMKMHPDYYMASLPEFAMATSVYKPVTNAGFAAMITGQSPAVNGVHDRSVHELKCATIFDDVIERGGKSLLVEGGIKILNIEVETLLNLDQNQNGTSDDEIFTTAMERLDSQEYAYTMVHFHSIDDAGHKSGPQGELTWNRIEAVDGYVRELVEAWDGQVIITSDHGMHAEEDAGNHGEFRAEDLIVPYLVMQGGKYEK